jgi:hypothetical protein
MQHHVYFWLKEEHLNDADKAIFEQSLDKLCSISYIKAGGWGKPAATTKRPVIDDSYTYCAYSSFDSITDHDLYQDDPDHLAFIENHKEWWQKVLIMDCE